jgi:lysophospholipase L1-like esterase
MRILFQGDSITDANRNRANIHDLGQGYAKYAAPLIQKAMPDTEFEFIDLGISGNRSDDILARSTTDIVDIDPDIISILIGINDVWHRHSHGREMTDEQFEANYRTLLERIRKETSAKIVILCPFLLDCEDKEPIREDLKTVLPIIRELAKEFADVYIPLDELFEEALKTQPEPRYYSGDAVHPNTNGAMFIGGKYAEAVKALIESL